MNDGLPFVQQVDASRVAGVFAPEHVFLDVHGRVGVAWPDLEVKVEKGDVARNLRGNARLDLDEFNLRIML